MSKITDKFIDVTGRVLRKIPNVPGKHFYSKILLKPIINRLDIEKTLKINSGKSRIICRLQDWIPWNIYLHGSYIIEELYENYMFPISSKSSTIFDVGANIGYYTIQFAQKTEGIVYAFEPMSYQYNTLLKNIEINELNNVYPVQQIVSDSVGKERIYFSGINNTAASSVVVETEDYEDIPTITLDQFCKEKNIEFIDLIKIDVEGYEMNVLKGLSEMLKTNRIKHMFIEVVERHLQKAGSSSEELFTYLKKYSYDGYSIKSGSLEQYEMGNDESLVYFKSIL